MPSPHLITTHIGCSIYTSHFVPFRVTQQENMECKELSMNGHNACMHILAPWLGYH